MMTSLGVAPKQTRNSRTPPNVRNVKAGAGCSMYSAMDEYGHLFSTVRCFFSLGVEMKPQTFLSM